MSDTYDFVRYEDDYIKIEQTGKSGWIADFKVYVKPDNAKVTISAVSWTVDGLNYSEGVVFDNVIMSDKSVQGGFTVGRSDNPLIEHTEYTVLSSYELYVDGEYVDIFGFSFTFKTTSRYEAQGVYPAPIIYGIKEDNFFSEFSAVIQIDENGIYCDYYIFVTITDSSGNSFRFDNSTLFLSGSSNGVATYVAPVPKDDISYGKIRVYVETVALEKSLGEDYRDIKTQEAYFFRIFRFNDLYGKFRISAEEWNTYNDALATALLNSGHGNYRYDEVIHGQQITVNLLNQPIMGYFNAFGWYYNNLTPRSTVHFGNIPEGLLAISAFQFFLTLEEMLNSLIYTEGN